MATFYFTYGTARQYPYCGGWTIVYAPDAKSAKEAFKAYHPNLNKDTLNCAGVYNEEDFNRTGMNKHGNLGEYCQEVIEIKRMKGHN